MTDENTLQERFNNWTDNLRDKRDWFAYRLTHPVSDYITEETEYNNYLQSGHIVGNTRLYVSRAILNAVFMWLFISLASNLIVVPFDLVILISDFAQTVLTITNVSLAIIGFIATIIQDIFSFANQNPQSLGFIFDFLGTQAPSPSAPITNIQSQITTAITEFGEENPTIGAIILVITEILLTIQSGATEITTALTGIISTEDINQLITPVSSGQDITPLLRDIEAIVPPANFIRNIFTIIVAPLFGVFFLAGRLYYPVYVGGERKRDINDNLPRAFTFMYALSEGGLGLNDILHELADSPDAYGEVSTSFKKVVRSIDRSDSDLTTTLLFVADETPSERLEDFLREFSGVIDTGSAIREFFKNKSEVALEEARDRQESFLQLYELMSEGYVIIFVAAPIFILVLQLVSGLTGSLNKGVTQAITYLGIPAGGFLVGAVLYITGDSQGSSYEDLDIPIDSYKTEIKRDPDERLREYKYLPYRISYLSYKLRRVIYKPFLEIKRKPTYNLLITGPIIIIYYLLAVQLGFIPLEIENFNEVFFQVTVFVYYIPFMMVAVPTMILYEAKRIRRKRAAKQLPDLFRNVAEANKRGLTLQEALETAALSGEGKLYDTLQYAVRQSKITGNLNRGLVEFANRMRVPRLSQSVKLLVEANKVSSDVTAVVEIISEDLGNLYDLQRERTQRARQYVAIVFISFFISAGVLFALDITFFSFIQKQIQSAGGNSTSGAGGGGAGYGGGLPVQFFRRVFMHTMLVLSLVSGVVAGLMEDSRILTGLKYSIAMSTVSVIGWFLIL